MDSYIKNQINERIIKMFPSLYSMAYKTIRGNPTTYTCKTDPRKNRPFQKMILDDNSSDKIIMKARQLGLSEVSLSECLWFLDVFSPVNVVYTFPRDSQLRKFSTSRVYPAIKQSKDISELLDEATNSIYSKKLRDSYLFLTSSWGGNLGEGVDCDMLCLDEYDRMEDGVEIAFKESLSASKFGRMRRWSTPTISGRGISEPWTRSSMNKYVWTCPHCGHKQFLDYKENVIQVKPNGVNQITKDIEPGTFIIACSQCNKELDRMSEGEWVSYGIGKTVSGYYISQMDASWITADNIKYKELTYPSPQLFQNYVLGLPYQSTGMSIIEEDLVRCTTKMTAPPVRTAVYSRIIVGIDWGKLNWAVILGLTNSGEIELIDLMWTEDDPLVPLKSVKELSNLIKPYNPDMIVADAGYGADRNAYLYQEFGSEVMYSCTWSTQKSVNSSVKFLAQWNDRNNTVNVDKTVEIQKMMRMIKDASMKMYHSNIDKTKVLYSHLSNMKIIDEEDDGKLYQIVVRIGADHLGCALTYATIGLNRFTNNGLTPVPDDINSGFDFTFI